MKRPGLAPAAAAEPRLIPVVPMQYLDPAAEVPVMALASVLMSNSRHGRRPLFDSRDFCIRFTGCTADRRVPSIRPAQARRRRRDEYLGAVASATPPEGATDAGARSSRKSPRKRQFGADRTESGPVAEPGGRVAVTQAAAAPPTGIKYPLRPAVHRTAGSAQPQQ